VGFPRRWRNVSSTACSVGLLAVAGCGGDEREAAPALPAELGRTLAARADTVAAELRTGDREGARAQARALRTAIVGAIQGGRVPPELQEHLLGAATALVAAIPPPPPPPPVEEEKDEDEDKGKGKDKGKEKKDDDE
jgi:hypothetical protein